MKFFRTPSPTPSSSVYSTTWNVSSTGIHTFFAIGRDSSGNFVATAPSSLSATTGSGTSPKVSLHSLPDVVSQGDAIWFMADASDLDGNVTQVEFFLNGSSLGIDTIPTYSADWTINPGVFQSGVYEVHAIARDDAGNYGMSAISTITLGQGGRANCSPCVTRIIHKNYRGQPLPLRC